jgi:hypothetical protein
MVCKNMLNILAEPTVVNSMKGKEVSYARAEKYLKDEMSELHKTRPVDESMDKLQHLYT